jgi:hypothetical protein
MLIATLKNDPETAKAVYYALHAQVAADARFSAC